MAGVKQFDMISLDTFAALFIHVVFDRGHEKLRETPGIRRLACATSRSCAT
jgi:hypothetical protein